MACPVDALGGKSPPPTRKPYLAPRPRRILARPYLRYPTGCAIHMWTAGHIFCGYHHSFPRHENSRTRLSAGRQSTLIGLTVYPPCETHHSIFVYVCQCEIGACEILFSCFTKLCYAPCIWGKQAGGILRDIFPSVTDRRRFAPAITSCPVTPFHIAVNEAAVHF